MSAYCARYRYGVIIHRMKMTENNNGLDKKVESFGEYGKIAIDLWIWNIHFLNMISV